MQCQHLDVEAVSERIALANCGASDVEEEAAHVQQAAARHNHRVRRAILATGLICGLFIAGVFCVAPRQAAAMMKTSAGVNHATELQVVATELQETSDTYDEATSPLAGDAFGLPGMPSTASRNAQSGDSSSDAKPTSINDIATAGADCGKNEELLLGVCYMNCSLLTQGRYPIRSAPNVCCRETPCMTPSQIDTNGVFPGSGYIVGGKGAGSFPHAPGGCAGNEESHLGLCYKKCSLLTNNEYPHRVMANTCCKASPCYNPFNLKTEGNGACDGFGVGGGLTDDEKCPHKPA